MGFNSGFKGLNIAHSIIRMCYVFTVPVTALLTWSAFCVWVLLLWQFSICQTTVAPDIFPNATEVTKLVQFLLLLFVPSW